LLLGVSIGSPSGHVILVALRLRTLHLATIQSHQYHFAQVPWSIVNAREGFASVTIVPNERARG
jgi:hypothetical protein